MIDVQLDIGDASGLVDEERIRRLCCFFQTEMGLPKECEVSVSFVDDERMRELNRGFRGIDRTTDVLSFECDSLDDGFPSGDGEAHVLGDIVVSPDVATRQAAELGHGFHDEVDLLVMHGLLHLCGYDHVDEDDAKVMEPLQDGLMAKWRTTRDGHGK